MEVRGVVDFDGDLTGESYPESGRLLLCERGFLLGESLPLLSLFDQVNVLLRARERFVDLLSSSASLASGTEEVADCLLAALQLLSAVPGGLLRVEDS